MMAIKKEVDAEITLLLKAKELVITVWLSNLINSKLFNLKYHII